MSVYDINGNALNTPYDTGGVLVDTLYDIDGDVVHSGGINYNNYTSESLYTIDIANCQGIAVYNDVLFQFRANASTISDLVCLFDFADGSDIVRNMAITSGHADSVSFSNEFYDNNDEFPLIYVTADIEPPTIYVNRITRTNATLVRTLVFPESVGYYGAGAFDFENGICYIVAYKINSYSGATNNATVVSKWDLTNLTDNGDGTYTPALISQYERDFIYVMQGLSYHDGHIWIASGWSSGGNPSYVYGMNPNTGVIDFTIDVGATEIEGTDWIYDQTSEEWYMVTGQQGGIYTKYTFGT